MMITRKYGTLSYRSAYCLVNGESFANTKLISTSSSDMAERLRQLGDFKGADNFEAEY